jgi:hypothetical protein
MPSSKMLRMMMITPVVISFNCDIRKNARMERNSIVDVKGHRVLSDCMWPIGIPNMDYFLCCVFIVLYCSVTL